MYEIPNLVYADKDGNIYDHPSLKMVVRSENFNFVPYELELIEIPKCTTFYYMPDSHPIAYNPETATLEEFSRGSAVSVFLPPGYLRLFLPAYSKKGSIIYPFYAYTAVGWLNGKFVVPAIKVERDDKCNPKKSDFTKKFKYKVEKLLGEYPNNRLYKQLAKCALEYNCTTAKNVFYGGRECPIPTSPVCNSRCLGCISLQPSESCSSPQQRIDFVPSEQEIVEVALNHYKVAKDPIISFGQGCEGDPIMVADRIAKAISTIKRKAPDLTINFNSNCSEPEKMKLLFEAGLDSIRVNINSFVESTYNFYYNPVGYRFDDVLKSVELANKYNVYVSLNCLIMPGINDRKSEINALLDFLSAYKVELIQLRNLNIDPDYLFEHMKFKVEEIIGIKNMLKLVKKKFKHIKFGYFNRPKKDFYKDFGLPKLNRR